jgi:DNA-binding PadR family transcriptional regulator
VCLTVFCAKKSPESGEQQMKYNENKPKQQPESFYRVLIILADLMNYYGKKYCYPSQQTIVDRLKKYHGYNIERRQLNYILCFLEESGQINRRRRHERGGDGSLILRSTLYFIKKKGWKLINRFRRIIGAPWEKAKKSTGPGKPESRDHAIFTGKFESFGSILSGLTQKQVVDPGD